MTINIKTDYQFLYNYFLRNKEDNKKLNAALFDPAQYPSLGFYTKNTGPDKARKIFVWEKDKDVIVETMMPELMYNNISKSGIVWWDMSNMLEITYVTRSYMNSSFGTFEYTARSLSPEDHEYIINLLNDHMLKPFMLLTEGLKNQIVINKER